jgi:hypothetical protein
VDRGQRAAGSKKWAGSGQWILSSGRWTVDSGQLTAGSGQQRWTLVIVVPIFQYSDSMGLRKNIVVLE